MDKQVDGIFQKRIKNAKKKKTAPASKQLPIVNDSNSSLSTILSSSANEIPSEATQCLENRRKLLDNFVEIVPGRIESLCPPNLIDFDAKVEETILDTARENFKVASHYLEIPLKQPLSSSACFSQFKNQLKLNKFNLFSSITTQLKQLY